MLAIPPPAAGDCSPQPPRKLKSVVRRLRVVCSDGFPAFLPKEVEKIKDFHAITLAKRIPVLVANTETSIMSSCVSSSVQGKADPVVLLHGFDSSCLEWRYAYPLLEEVALECWAIDVLGWGFSDIEGVGKMATLPKPVTYAGVALLKSATLRFYVSHLAFNSLSWSASLEWTNIGRLHCLLPWWKDATVNYIFSGGYNVSHLISQVKQKTLIIWGENDQIISNRFAVRLHCDMQNAILRQIPDCGHIPHVEKPIDVANLIEKFTQGGCC